MFAPAAESDVPERAARCRGPEPGHRPLLGRACPPTASTASSSTSTTRRPSRPDGTRSRSRPWPRPRTSRSTSSTSATSASRIATVAPADRGKYLAFTYDGLSDADDSAGLRRHVPPGRAGPGRPHPRAPPARLRHRDDRGGRVGAGQPRQPVRATCATPTPPCRPSCAWPAATRPSRQVLDGILAAQGGDTEEIQAIVGYLRDLDGFNWGYDPFHYSAPEGSYAVDRRGRRAHRRVPRHGPGAGPERPAHRDGRGLQPHQRVGPGGALGARPHRPRLLPPAQRGHRRGRAVDLLREHRHRARHDGEAHDRLAGLVGHALQGGRLPLRPDGPPHEGQPRARPRSPARAHPGRRRGRRAVDLPLRRGLGLRRGRRRRARRERHPAQHGRHRHRHLQRPPARRGARRRPVRQRRLAARATRAS